MSYVIMDLLLKRKKLGYEYNKPTVISLNAWSNLHYQYVNNII